MVSGPIMESVITCPKCGHRKREKMPTDTCSPAPDRGERHGSESKAVAAIGAAADRSFSGAQGELRVLEEVSRFHPQQHAHHAKETEAGEGVQPALPGDLGSE